VGREWVHHVPSSLREANMGALYIGGPRPSGLPVASLQALVENLSAQIGDAPIDSVTLELDPADATSSVLTALHDLGVTRLSVTDAPSLDDQLRAVNRARDTGFEEVSVDLVFGGAESSLSRWKNTLHQAVEHHLPHITLLEAESKPAGDDERADCFAFAMRMLSAKGYEQYELTHFARPGAHSPYQEHVYAHGDVLGLGPGAESFLWPDRTDPSTARRWSNVSDVTTYVTQLRNDESPAAHHEDFDWGALAREYILLRLRTDDGLDLAVLREQYHCPLRDRQADTLDRLARNGLILDESDQVRLTPRGRLLADAVTQRLIRDA
jgi:oxygen-independent coproporphyrinogen-3 oxidase